MRREICVGAQGVIPRVDDIVAAAAGDVDIVLDCSNLTRVKKESPAPKAFVRDTEAVAEVWPAGPDNSHTSDRIMSFPASTLSVFGWIMCEFASSRWLRSALGVQVASSEQLSSDVSRAAVFCALVRLATGSSGCRAVVLQTLQLLLAKGDLNWVLPKKAVDSDALAALPALLSGDVSIVGLSDAKAAADVGVSEPPGFSAAERLQLLSGSPASCGALALAATQAQALLSANSATLALACEALQGSSAMFSDMKLPDVSASKNVSAIASDVIALLESSTFANKKPKDGGKGTIGAVVKVCLMGT